MKKKIDRSWVTWYFDSQFRKYAEKDEREMVFEDKRKDRNLKEIEGEYLCAASASHRLLRANHRHAFPTPYAGNRRCVSLG